MNVAERQFAQTVAEHKSTIILWLGWFFYETHHQNHDYASGLFWGGSIGGAIGAICGFSIHFKTQRQYQDIIDQIEDLTA